MSAAEVFFDTNVVLYLLSEDAGKADRAEELLASGGRISVQVLNEFATVASRKLSMGWPEIGEILAQVRAVTARHHEPDQIVSATGREGNHQQKFGLRLTR